MREENETEHEHPSYGSISLSRVQSTSADLFGSAVKHTGLVMLEIHEAKAIVNSVYNEMRTMPKGQIVQVYMSEAQFAEFISKWNDGRGTPCTLTRRPEAPFKLVSTKPPPAEKSVRDNFEGVIDESVKNVSALIEEHLKEIEEIVMPRATKKDQERLRMLFLTMRQNVPSNLKFAQTMLHESLEKTLSRAKVEMEAAGRSLLERMGLSSLADQAKKFLPSLDLGNKDDE